MGKIVTMPYNASASILSRELLEERGLHLPGNLYALVQPPQPSDGELIVDGPLPDSGVFVRIVGRRGRLAVCQSLRNSQGEEVEISRDLRVKIVRGVQRFLEDGYITGGRKVTGVYLGEQPVHVRPTGFGSTSSPGMRHNVHFLPCVNRKYVSPI